MKRKNNIFTVFMALTMSFFSYSSWGVEKIKTESDKPPEAVVRQFYTDYLTAWSEPDVQLGLEHSQNVIEANTTSHLRTLNNDNDSGADYFTHVQDVCPDWVSNIATKVLSKRNGSAIVELTLGKDDSESTYHINLVNENKKWLMDSVKFEIIKTDHCNDN